MATDDQLTRVRAALARLAEVEREATPGPWIRGYVTRARTGHLGVPGDRCPLCQPSATHRDHGALWRVERNGEIHAHRSRDEGSEILDDGGEKIAGQFDYDNGGIGRDADAAAIVALRNAAPALLALAEAATAHVARAAEKHGITSPDDCYEPTMADLWRAVAALADAPGEVQP